MEETTTDIFQNISPELGILLLSGLIVFSVLVIFMVKRIQKANNAKAVKPMLVFQQIQKAPLGREILFKIKNMGEVAKIKKVIVLKRQDLKIARFYSDFELERTKSYSIFIESTGRNKIDANFDIQISYLDKLGNLYHQVFNVKKEANGAKEAKLVTYA